MSEVTKTKATKSELSSEIDLELPDTLTVRQKNRVKDEVGELLVDFILEQVSDLKSPIEGQGKFEKLSPKYKKLKQKDGRGGSPNLEFSGSMLDALETKRTSDGVKIQIKGSDAGKADGHNNFSGKSKLPSRQFLPKEGENFKRSARKEVDRIVNEAIVAATKVKKSGLRDIQSRRALTAYLNETFPALSTREAETAILVNPELRELFDEFDLLELFGG